MPTTAPTNGKHHPTAPESATTMTTLTLDPASDTDQTAPNSTRATDSPVSDTTARPPLSDTRIDTDTANTGNAEPHTDADTTPHLPLSDTHPDTNAADTTRADASTDVHADTRTSAPDPAAAAVTDDEHRAALAGLKRKADQIRYAAAAVAAETGTLTEEDPAPAEVLAWLSRFGIEPNPSYARGVVAEWRHEYRSVDLSPLPESAQDDEPEPAPELPPLPPAEEMDEGTAALAARVATARGRLPLQSDRALYEALSEDELKAERELAEWERATDREIRRRTKEAQLQTVKRDQDAADDIAKIDARDRRWHSKALAARRRMVSADANLAMLFRNSEWSSRALIGVVIVGMIWSGVNVQHNLVPSGNMWEALYWLSYGLEAMISVPIIVIMVVSTSASRIGITLDRGKVVLAELALLSLTVGLNTGPHLDDPGTAAKYAIAPVMVGAAVWMHAWVATRYADLIKGAAAGDGKPATTDRPAE